MQKATKQRAGQHEIALGAVGQGQGIIADSLRPANEFLNRTARRDDSKLLAGRAGADVARAFTSGGQNIAASTGKAGALSGVNRLQKEGVGTAFTTAKRRASASRDSNINQAAKIGLGETALAGRATGALATEEFKDLESKARLAAEKANNVRGAITGVASLAAGTVGNNKREARLDKAFKAFKDNPGDANSFDEFMRLDAASKTPKFSASTSEKFLGAFGGGV